MSGSSTRERQAGTPSGRAFKIMAALGTVGLVLSLVVFVVPILWGAGEVFLCGTNSYKPWFDPDDFSSYERPIMCGNGLAWFAIAAPVVALALAAATSFVLLLGARKPLRAAPIAIVLFVVLLCWIGFAVQFLGTLRAFEVVPMTR